MDRTEHLSLPLLASAQAQKHVTHNEALIDLDALVQLSVTRRDLDGPPEGVADGVRFVVGAGARDAWSGRAGAVAVRSGGGWRFLSPRAGWRAWVEAEERMVVFDGAAWVPLGASAPAGPSALALSAQAPGTQTIPSRTHTPVTAWTVSESSIADATFANGRFLVGAASAGRYLLSATVVVNSTTASVVVRARRERADGTVDTVGHVQAPGGGTLFAGGSLACGVSLAPGDAVSVEAYHTHDAAVAVNAVSVMGLTRVG